jgi:hypothetical protein
VKKDEFMEAIGANEENSAPIQLGHWEGSDDKQPEHAAKAAKLTGELKRELADIEESGAGAERDSGPSLFGDWIGEANAQVCTPGARKTTSIKREIEKNG